MSDNRHEKIGVCCMICFMHKGYQGLHCLHELTVGNG